MNKRPALASCSCSANVNSNSSSNATSSAVKKCPKLKADECKLLMDHNGCFKCCLFDQSHGSHNCPNDFPDGNKYQKITAYRDAVGNPPKRKDKGAHTSKNKPIASVTTTDAGEPDTSNEDDFITAVMPSAILGSGSFSEDDVSPPMRSKHFVSKFNIAAQHLDFPLTFSTLINNGAHLVLICPMVVDALRLECHLLKVPETVSVAISKQKRKLK